MTQGVTRQVTVDDTVHDAVGGKRTFGKPFVLAHLSDPHLAPLPRPGMRELASKRLIGYLNWRRSRNRVNRRDVLDAITRDLHGAQPDHVAVTGDLVNIALPAEFAHARRWLEALGRPADVSVVPGNHDAYVAAADIDRDRHWSLYMAGDDALSGSAGRDDQRRDAAPSSLVGEGWGGGSGSDGTDVPRGTTLSAAELRYGDGSATQQGDRSRQQPTSVGGGEKPQFPYLRRRGPLALIGVSTAIATPPFMATGKVGEQQIARLARMLDDLRAEGMFRVVMIHHPPIPSARHKRLVDAMTFRQAIAAVGAELIIHGHDHVHSLVWIAGNGGQVPMLGVPSASAGAGTRHAAAYNLYSVSAAAGGWRCEVVTRGLRPSGAVAELNRIALSWSGKQ